MTPQQPPRKVWDELDRQIERQHKRMKPSQTNLRIPDKPPYWGKLHGKGRPKL